MRIFAEAGTECFCLIEELIRRKLKNQLEHWYANLPSISRAKSITYPRMMSH